MPFQFAKNTGICKFLLFEKPKAIRFVNRINLLNFAK
jgi:hypothetical protein